MSKIFRAAVRHDWRAALILPDEYFDKPAGAELAASAVCVSSATADLTTAAGGGWYLKFPADAGNDTANNKLCQLSGIATTGAINISLEFAENVVDPNTSSRGAYLYDGRRGLDVDWDAGNATYFFEENNAITQNGVSNFKLNGVNSTNSAWRTCLAGDKYSFDSIAQTDGVIAIGGRFNRTTGFPLLALKNITITDINGTHTVDMSTSGGTSNQFTSTDGAITLKLFGFTGTSHWIQTGGGGGAAAQLQAAAASVSSATAALTTGIRIAAAATAIAACSAGLSTGIRLQSSAVSVSTATASLTTQAAGMSAAAVGQSTATASLTTGIRLAAAPIGRSAATAQLSTAIRMVAAAVGQSSATAALTVQAGSFGAAAVATSTATANLTTGIRLSAVAAGVSSSTAALTSQIRLQANAAAQATASGTLTGVSAALSAAAVARSSVSASLSTAIRLQASTFAGSSCSADLSTQILVQAAAYSVSEVTADLTTAGQLPPKINAYEIKMTRITGAYKLEQLRSFSVTSGTQRFALQQQDQFSIFNSTPKFQIERV